MSEYLPLMCAVPARATGFPVDPEGPAARRQRDAARQGNHDMNSSAPRPPGDFTRFIGTPYERFILPIIPAGAKLKPREDGNTVDPEKLGRMPGAYLSHLDQWIGLREWSSHRANATKLERWQGWHKPGLLVPIAILTPEFPVADGDINREDDACEIATIMIRELGPTAVRTRPNSHGFGLVYRWKRGEPPVYQTAVTYTCDRGGKHLLESCGHGQNFMIEGPHRSGEHYEWPYGDLLDWQDELPEISGADMSRAFQRVREWVTSQPGYTLVESQVADFERPNCDNFEIGSPFSPLVTPKIDTLAEAVRAIDLNSDRFVDAAAWIPLVIAIKAASNGDQKFFDEVFCPWLVQRLENRAHGREWAQTLWNVIRYATVGADFVYAWAASFGWDAGTEQEGRILDHAPDPLAPAGGGNSENEPSDGLGEAAPTYPASVGRGGAARALLPGHCQVPTRVIQAAVKGREAEILDSLEIDWRSGQPHITCPYPDHDDDDPSWRWDDKKARAYCTCIGGSHSILDVVGAKEGVDFEAAKIRVAQILKRDDLIREGSLGKAHHHQVTDAASLLNAPADQCDDILPGAYLAYRLSVPAEEVLMPSTATVGLKALSYFDPSPEGSKAKPKLVGHFPCAVFATVAADGRTHAHRIYLAPGSAGKAELGIGPDGHARNAKKSAKVSDGVSRSGCSVVWGDPALAAHVLLTEGIETGSAVALAFRSEIEACGIAVAACISAGGVEAFQLYPVTQKVTVCADRDEADKPNGKPGSRRGEKAARKFGLLNYERVGVTIALPGNSGETVDWLDVFRRDGIETVRGGIQAAIPFEPTSIELEELARGRSRTAELATIAETYPLPQMDTLHLQYALTTAGKVKVHRWNGLRTDANGARVPDLTPVATPFGITARLRHADQQDAYGLRCVVQDMNGQPRAVDFNRAELAKLNGSEIRSKLFAAGLRTEGEGEKIALEALKAADPAREIIIVRRPGWQEVLGLPDPVFVCPNGEVIGAPEDLTLELATSSRLEPGVAVAGDTSCWRRAIEAALSVTGCPHWTLGIIAAFAGVLVSLIGLDTCGINFSGQSSSGKSTAQRLAVSAWSTPEIRRLGLAQSARATDNATEALAERATGTILSLDELAHTSGKVVGKLIYMIAGGVGKQRMRADASLRDSYCWSTFAVLSAECSLEEKIRTDDGEWLAGMAVRIVDVDVTDVDRKVDPNTLRLIDETGRHYGHAGPNFVRAIISHGLHRQAQAQALRDRVLAAGRQLAGADADSAVARAATPFALLLIAGELAKAFDVIPRSADVAKTVEWAWEAFQHSNDSAVLDPETEALANLRRYILERWDVTIKPACPGLGANREAVGWYDDHAVYIPKNRIREATGGILKESHIGTTFDARGMLASRSEPDRFTVPWVPKVGRVTSYALRRSEFGRSDSIKDPETRLTVHDGAADG
jgi:hypothetical protein